MNAVSLFSFGRALVFAAGFIVLSAQIGHAQGKFPPVTGAQPSRLVAVDNCCRSGLAQIVLMLPRPATTQVNYLTDRWRGLAHLWHANKYQQQKVIRTKLGDIALIPLLSSPGSPPLSVSADPQSKVLKVSFRVPDNKIQRLTHICGTFDLEVLMVFETTAGVTVRSSDIKSSNFVPRGTCSDFQSIGDRLNDQVFADAGTAVKLANYFNALLRRSAGEHGIRAVTPGVRPENREMLVFEITPAEVAVPTRDVQVSPPATYTLPPISEEGGVTAQCRPGFALTSLKCTGHYCDNIQGVCTAYDAVPAARSTRVPYWTAWYSEEKNAHVIAGSNFPQLDDAYSLAIGFQCRGRYCDDLRFYMLPMRGAGVPTLDSKAEFPQCRLSARFSEEQSPPLPASPRGKSMEFIRRVGCSGSYCDNLQIEWCKVFHSGWNW